MDGITLRRELEALSTHESGPERREAELDREREAFKDARVQILARELDAEAREAGLRDQEARLAARERQQAERQMQELAVARKGLRISRRLVLVKHNVSGASWARRMLSCLLQLQPRPDRRRGPRRWRRGPPP
jgi:hypothetical protein